MYISLGRTVKVNSSWISLKASKDDFTNMFMQKFKHPTTQKAFINLFVTQAGFSTYRFLFSVKLLMLKRDYPIRRELIENRLRRKMNEEYSE